MFSIRMSSGAIESGLKGVSWNPTPNQSIELTKKSLDTIKGLFSRTVEAEDWDALSEQSEAGRDLMASLTFASGHSEELDAEIKEIRDSFDSALLKAERVCFQGYIDAADDALFRESNAGNGGKNCNDCLVRAISVVLDRPYQEIWDDLNSRLPEPDETPDHGVDSMVTSAYLDLHGFKREKKVGTTVQDQIGNGDAIVLTQILGYGHVVAIKDNKVVDTWNTGALKVLSVLRRPS